MKRLSEFLIRFLLFSLIFGAAMGLECAGFISNSECSSGSAERAAIIVPIVGIALAFLSMIVIRKKS